MILSLSIWNIILIYKIKTSAKGKNKIKNKELFFDLKYRIQLITTVFSIIIAAIAFFGYSSFDKIRSDIDNQISERFDRHKELYEKLQISKDSLILEYQTINDSLCTLKNNNRELNNDFENNKKQLNAIQSKLNRISEKEILTSNIYVIKNLTYKIEKNSSEYRNLETTLYFRNLKTISGNNLPTFKTPPSINIIPIDGSDLESMEITTDYFRIHCGGSYADDFEPNFDIWIISND